MQWAEITEIGIFLTADHLTEACFIYIVPHASHNKWSPHATNGYHMLQTTFYWPGGRLNRLRRRVTWRARPRENHPLVSEGMSRDLAHWDDRVMTIMTIIYYYYIIYIYNLQIGKYTNESRYRNSYAELVIEHS